MDSTQENQMAYQLLKMMSRQKTEYITLFYETYRRHFSIVQVPCIEMPAGGCRIVKVNRQRAIDFIKQRYQFYDRKELGEALAEIAKEIEAS